MSLPKNPNKKGLTLEDLSPQSRAFIDMFTEMALKAFINKHPEHSKNCRACKLMLEKR